MAGTEGGCELGNENAVCDIHSVSHELSVAGTCLNRASLRTLVVIGWTSLVLRAARDLSPWVSPVACTSPWCSVSQVPSLQALQNDASCNGGINKALLQSQLLENLVKHFVF